MVVQIYTMQSVEEALDVIGSGARQIGVTPGRNGLPGEIGFETARAICDAARGRALSSALTVSSDIEEMLGMVEAVRPDILHICGPSATLLPPEALSPLRGRLKGVRIMQAVSVSSPAAVEQALSYEEVADILLLDTEEPSIGGIGASGKTHDWELSRRIVERSRIPVILAGGLSPENVAAAVRTVRPWGVDSLTHTNTPLSGGGFRKDITKVKRFIEAARSG